MIKIKMTYDRDAEVMELLELIKDKIKVRKLRQIPDDKRKRLIIWADKKE